MYRLDIQGRVKSFRRTPQGGILAPAYLTRTGVFTYAVSDGKGGTKAFRELRHPDEVFSQESLDSLASAPVTRGHPNDAVTPETWKDVSIGHVGDSVRVEERYVAADVRVQDAGAVGDIEGGRLVEFSCGYDADVLLQAGVYDGIAYDAVQKNIRYNHVGMGPVGWGRAGNEVRLRVDGGVMLTDSDSDHVAPTLPGMDLAEALKLLASLQARVDAAEAEVAKLTKARTDAVDAATAITKERDVALGERDVAVKRADAAEKSVGDKVASRVALVQDARAILGESLTIDGMSDNDVRVATIKKVDPDFNADGQSEDYVRGVFASTVRSSAAADASLGKLRSDAANAAPGGPTKSLIDQKIDEAKAAPPAWKKTNAT